MVYGAFRVAGNFSYSTIFGVYQNAATTMAHPAVAFNHRIVAIHLHFPFNIGTNEIWHIPSLMRQIKSRSSMSAAQWSEKKPIESVWTGCEIAEFWIRGNLLFCQD
ncbi:hypothetical protein ES703_77498 [subsurface metagenome]